MAALASGTDVRCPIIGTYGSTFAASAPATHGSASQRGRKSASFAVTSISGTRNSDARTRL